MPGFSRPMGVLVGGILFGVACVPGAYLLSARRLAAAREARRGDNCSQAERSLAACWRLPGLRSAIELEEQLSAVQQGDLRNEKAWQSQSAGNSADNRLILEALAKGKLAHFQWATAQKYAESILDKDPADARALWLKARARIEMHLEEQALADLERALQSEPDDFEIRRTHADLLHRLGHVKKAIVEYEQLHNERPDSERVIVALAQCWQEQAKLEDARELLDRLLDGQPVLVSALIERGRLALRMGDPQAAEKSLRRAVELNPDHADANFVLRLALQAQRKVDAAIDARVLQIDRRQAEVIQSLREPNPQLALLTDVGQWMVRTGQEHDAAAWFYSALKEDANYRPAHLGLAQLFGRNGQTRRAQAHARLAGTDMESQLRAADTTASRPPIRQLRSSQQLAEDPHPSEALSEDVHRLCAACHAYPPPETMPRSAWRKEVKQGYDLLRGSALAGDFPALESVALYYEHRAPDRLPQSEQPATTVTPPVKFERRGIGWMPNVPPYPSVANAQLTRVFGNSNQQLLLCESRLNALLVVNPNEPGPGGMVISGLTAPCHTTVADLDGDRQNDILVASLGQFFPTNDKLGQVLWLRATASGQFETKTILDGVGRVADVQVADFNGDSKLDLVVAVFGWRATGEILYLENRTTDWSKPQFVSHVVDSRHGAIHVPVADLNGDGRPDFLGLISQEHETVVAYLNDGGGAFRKETIFAAPHPSYGSSGIEIVDMDGDHDFDVLLTNGDILDRPHILKPYHSVQWLENEGTFPYQHHVIAPLYGAARAVAADFDSDGDQDVLAVTLLPELLFPEREKLRLPSVVLYEQQTKRQFVTHVLETGSCDHFSCAAGDWDNDGRPDFSIGNFAWDGSRPMADAAMLWRNAGRP
jgi:tetratricopeptide (TPR) repeat protein